MTWFNALLLYLLVWWVTLFAVLPLGVAPQAEADRVTGWRGTPGPPQLLRKAIITTVVATIVWGGIYGMIESDLFSFRSGWLAMPEN